MVNIMSAYVFVSVKLSLCDHAVCTIVPHNNKTTLLGDFYSIPKNYQSASSYCPAAKILEQEESSSSSLTTQILS